MIKVINCKNKNYKNKLKIFLDKRRSGKIVDTSIVSKIIKDIKKNKLKALIKYEKKFSKNTKIKPTQREINQSIKTLDDNVKKAIDFAYYEGPVSGCTDSEACNYNGDAVVGARQWQGAIIEVPAMGNDGSDYTNGYMDEDSTPQFKLLKNDELINLRGEVPAWSNNQLYIISNLTESIAIPEATLIILCSHMPKLKNLLG